MQAEWRSASMEFGGQFVMMDGMLMMPGLCADSWDIVSTQVQFELVLHWDKNQQHWLCSCNRL